MIDFTGGEPLLHRELPQLLALAKSLGMITTVTTNGLLYPKRAEQLRGLIDMLHFSLDSPHQQEHDQSRGVACFDKVMDSIQIAKSMGERPDILFTVFGHNVHQIKDLYHNICQPNGLVLILNPVFEYNSVGENLSEQAMNEMLFWGKQKGIYLNEAFVSLRKDGGNDIKKPICKAASTTLVISPDNKLVVPCYHLGTESYEINNQLFELYHSASVQKMVAQEGRLPECQGCVINCYMQPSFAVEINKYFWKALPSTLKYNYMKGTWKQLFV